MMDSKQHKNPNPPEGSAPPLPVLVGKVPPKSPKQQAFRWWQIPRDVAILLPVHVLAFGIAFVIIAAFWKHGNKHVVANTATLTVCVLMSLGQVPIAGWGRQPAKTRIVRVVVGTLILIGLEIYVALVTIAMPKVAAGIAVVDSVVALVCLVVSYFVAPCPDPSGGFSPVQRVRALFTGNTLSERKSTK